MNNDYEIEIEGQTTIIIEHTKLTFTNYGFVIIWDAPEKPIGKRRVDQYIPVHKIKRITRRNEGKTESV